MEKESGAKQEEEKKFHVLAVDDSFIDRKLIERLLKVSSYQVTCVESGDKALEFLGLSAAIDDKFEAVDDDDDDNSSQHNTEVKVNLIITDYCMPGISGYDLLKIVKGSSWKDVPVVVMSSENVPSRVSMCLEGGAEEFLLKPVQLSDVKKLQPYIMKKRPSSVDDHCHDHEDSDKHTDSQCLSHTRHLHSDSLGKREGKSISPDSSEKKRKKNPTDLAFGCVIIN